MDQWEELKQENSGFETQESMEVFETELEALGLFGIQDPLRDAIVSSVKVVSKAGISVIMCTGDNLDTAIAISKNAGIVSDELIN
jgi:P-type E1-E2 ATPase